jgi:hypothetical protein
VGEAQCALEQAIIDGILESNPEVARKYLKEVIAPKL